MSGGAAVFFPTPLPEVGSSPPPCALRRCCGQKYGQGTPHPHLVASLLLQGHGEDAPTSLGIPRRGGILRARNERESGFGGGDL